MVTSLLEYQRALEAAENGAFRHPKTVATATASPAPASGSPQTWEATGAVVPVIGALHGVGVTTMAWALAHALQFDEPPVSVRLVECCSVDSTGLDQVVSAELRGTPDRFIGRHERVRIERVRTVVSAVAQVPPPSPHTCAVTVLDLSGWDVSQIWEPGWIATTVAAAPAIVLVTAATPAALPRTDRALARLGNHPPRVVQVHVGQPAPKRRRGRPTRQDHVAVPVINDLLHQGLTADIPPELQDAADDVWDLLPELSPSPATGTDPSTAPAVAQPKEGTLV